MTLQQALFMVFVGCLLQCEWNKAQPCTRCSRGRQYENYVNYQIPIFNYQYPEFYSYPYYYSSNILNSRCINCQRYNGYPFNPNNGNSQIPTIIVLPRSTSGGRTVTIDTTGGSTTDLSQSNDIANRTAPINNNSTSANTTNSPPASTTGSPPNTMSSPSPNTANTPPTNTTAAPANTTSSPSPNMPNTSPTNPTGSPANATSQ